MIHMTTQVASRNNIYSDKKSLFATQCMIRETLKGLTKDEIMQIMFPDCTPQNEIKH